MDEILQAIETLVTHNCLTVAEALDKAFAAGHRKAVKELEKPEMFLVGSGGSGVSSASTIGQSPV